MDARVQVAIDRLDGPGRAPLGRHQHRVELLGERHPPMVQPRSLHHKQWPHGSGAFASACSITCRSVTT